MADEIKLLSRLTVVKASADVDREYIAPSALMTWTGTELLDTIISVGFSAEEALPLGDCASIGWCYAENLDATNFVTIYMATGHTVGLKLLAGEGYAFRLNASAPYAKADTAAVRMRWVVHEV